MHWRRITVTCLISLVPAGCLAVVGGAAVGGAFYHDANKKQSREEFMAGFRTTNLEREKDELPLLDISAEKYHYDRTWARKDPDCRERIGEYENGDESALSIGQPSNRLQP